MSRVLSCLVALSVSSVCLAQPPPTRDNPNPSATGTAIIRGRVMVAGAERPLSKVEIRAASPTTGVTKATMTDGDGRYAIADLPAGRYTVSARKPNYVPVSFGQRRPLGNGQPIDVADGKAIDRIDFTLQRGGVITGKIVDEFGDPLANVQVMPMRYFFVNGGRRLQPMGQGGTSNDLGEYRMYGLTPGQYFVSATLPTSNFGSDTTDRTAYQPTYYPGTGNVGDAQRLMVQGGQTISGINLSLLPVTASRVSGVALDANGRPMSGAFVNAFPRNTFAFFPGGGQVRPDGTFTINGLPPGDYTLRASSGPDDLASADVTVNGGDVSNVQLAPRMPSTLRGRVVFERAAIPPPLTTAVRINASPLVPGGAFMPGNLGGSTVAKQDWTFDIKGGGGAVVRVTAFVQAGPTPNQPPNPVTWRVRRVLVGDADVTDSGFEWPANSTLDNVVVEMTTRVAEVDATVIDANNARVGDCVIVMFSPDSQRWAQQSRFFASGRPDSEGVFHGRVPAGDYLIVAFDDPEQMPGIFSDPEILSQLRDRATAITVTEETKKTIQLTLSQPPVY